MLNMTVFRQPLEMFLKILLQQYLNESYCLTVISENLLDVNMISGSMTYIIVYTDNIYEAKSKETLIDQLLTASEMGCSDYIIQMSKPEVFLSAYEKVNHIGNVRRGDRKLVFLPSGGDDAEKLLNILALKETSFIANLLLVVPTQISETCETYDLVTHKYGGPDEGIHDPLYLDRWNSCTLKFSRKSKLFPHDISNLQGKTVKIACFTYEPYVILDLDEKVEPLGRDGTEIRIVDEFCRWVNCNIEIIRDDVYEWGDIYENGTGNGVLGNIAEDRVDLGITALYSWFDFYTRLDFSVSCIRSGITCVAPAPRLLASWELPLMAFSWVIWIIVFCTFLYASLALYIAHRFSTRKVFLITFGMMITQSQRDPGDNWRVRSITGWLLITGLVVDNAYSSGLAATFTVPKYEKSIDTVQDIVDSGMPWGATHDAWIFSLILSQEPKIMQLVKQFRTYEAEVLKQKTFTRNMAFSIEKLPAGTVSCVLFDTLVGPITTRSDLIEIQQKILGYFAIGEYLTAEAVMDMELMLEDFYYEYTVVMARKSSPYIAKITELVGRLHESGLMIAWETQVALKYLNYKVQLQVKLSRSRREVEIAGLGFRHVVGIFFVYILGVTASIIIFICEMFFLRRKMLN